MTTEIFTVYQADTWFLLTDAERCAIKDWLTAHDIDPESIPPSEPITVEGSTIHYWGMTIEKKNGKIMKVKAVTDKDGQPNAVIEERSAPLKTAPPATPGVSLPENGS